ncbi:MAG: PEP-CTERM sorting domain-containing protein [Rubrivivax sp.]|jgi:hypothetical protein|nr:PEP-CTERM sorting domain-containing protein [Rubrivivax sp.]
MNSARLHRSALTAIVALMTAVPAAAYTLTPSGGFTTSTAGAVTFATFDGSTPVDPIYATISGGFANGGTDPGAGGNWLGAGGGATGTINIVFTGNHSYFGLYWGTNDGFFNKVEMFNGATSLGSLTGVPASPNSFWNINASNAGEIFNRIELTVNGAGGCCFEVDNLAVMAVPEPMSAALMGLGVVGIGAWRRRARG